MRSPPRILRSESSSGYIRRKSLNRAIFGIRGLNWPVAGDCRRQALQTLFARRFEQLETPRRHVEPRLTQDSPDLSALRVWARAHCSVPDEPPYYKRLPLHASITIGWFICAHWDGDERTGDSRGRIPTCSLRGAIGPRSSWELWWHEPRTSDTIHRLSTGTWVCLRAALPYQ